MAQLNGDPMQGTSECRARKGKEVGGERSGGDEVVLTTSLVPIICCHARGILLFFIP